MRPKSKFLTFVLSLFPGAGHMYLGFMKQGVELMAVFLAACVLISFIGSELGFFIPLFIAYSVFDALKKRNYNVPPNDASDLDVFYWFGYKAPTTLKNLKRKKMLALALMLIGAYLVLDGLVLGGLRQLSWAWDDSGIFYDIQGYLRILVVAGLLIFGGVKLMKHVDNIDTQDIPEDAPTQSPPSYYQNPRPANNVYGVQNPAAAPNQRVPNPGPGQGSGMYQQRPVQNQPFYGANAANANVQPNYQMGFQNNANGQFAAQNRQAPNQTRVNPAWTPSNRNAAQSAQAPNHVSGQNGAYTAPSQKPWNKENIEDLIREAAAAKKEERGKETSPNPAPDKSERAKSDVLAPSKDQKAKQAQSSAIKEEAAGEKAQAYTAPLVKESASQDEIKKTLGE